MYKVKPTDLDLDILDYSIKRGMGHIPSALSQAEYLSTLLREDFIHKFKFVAGKPFGAQAWYHLLGFDSDSPLLEPPVVHWNCQTIGHSLGYSIGLATMNPVWLNISDASLEAGDFWEALQLWSKFKPSMLYVTVDCNGHGCRHKTATIEQLRERISKFGVNCHVQMPDQIIPFNGIALVDTSGTFGAHLKSLGFHYEKFNDMRDFNAQYRERLVKG